MAKGTPCIVTFDQLGQADREAPREVQGCYRLITCQHDKLYSGCTGSCQAGLQHQQ